MESSLSLVASFFQRPPSLVRPFLFFSSRATTARGLSTAGVPVSFFEAVCSSFPTVGIGFKVLCAKRAKMHLSERMARASVMHMPHG